MLYKTATIIIPFVDEEQKEQKKNWTEKNGKLSGKP